MALDKFVLLLSTKCFIIPVFRNKNEKMVLKLKICALASFLFVTH
jgi:hypothetical protein